MTPETANDVLSFWFGDEHPPSERYQKRWFGGGEALDRDITNRFGELHAQLSNGLSPSALTDPHQLLSAIIVIDQFGRNIYRRSALAFSWDQLAQQWAQYGLQNGYFENLSAYYQAFAAMPLMHSEDLSLHQQAIRFYTQLKKSQPDTDTIITGFYSSALQHHDIIAQFGRYPHRNAVLGRESTPAEIAYLNDGAKRFGQ